VAHPVRLAKRAIYKHLHTFPAPLYGNELVNRLPTLRKYPLVTKHPENGVTYIEQIYIVLSDIKGTIFVIKYPKITYVQCGRFPAVVYLQFLKSSHCVLQ